MTSPALAGSVLALISTVFFGATGIFAKLLATYDIPPLIMIFARSLLAVVVVGTALALLHPTAFRIKRRDLPYFLAQGLLGQTLMSWFAFTAFTLTSVAVAILLIYTAPAFITVFAAVFLREPVVRQKVIGLVATMVGLVFVVGILEAGRLNASPFAVVMALGSALCYAAFALISKVTVGRYSPWTALFYGHTFGIAFQVTGIVLSGTTIPAYTLTSFGFQVGSSAIMLISLVLYFSALARIEASRAAILMMLDPVFATLWAFLVFGEVLTGWQIVGAAFILGGATVAQLPVRRRPLLSLAETAKP